MGKHGKNYIVGKAIFLHFTKTISGKFTVVLLPERKIYVKVTSKNTVLVPHFITAQEKAN